jgi:hypothetical protein
MNRESQTRHTTDDAEQTHEAVYNAAQEARGAADDDLKTFADTANVRGGETWGNASGHSATRGAWLATALIIAGFAIGGVGLTFGPHVLIWIGAALAVLVGVLGASTRVWSDYRTRS